MKLWKKIGICALALISCFGFSSCKKGGQIDVSKDLDGDGVISEWETIYDPIGSSDRTLPSGNIKQISTFAELKALNEKTEETNYYILTSNIDCGGETVTIDLGKSTLFGNNYVIKNFQLGDYKYSVGEGDDKQEIEANVSALIVNGLAVYDLRLFVGLQTITIDNLNTYSVVSPLVNVKNIDNLVVKGRINLKRNKLEGLGRNYVDVSLGMANLNRVDGQLAINSTISRITTTGVIDYADVGDTITTLTMGAVMPYVFEGTMLCNVYSNAILKTDCDTQYIGGIVGTTNDLVTTTKFDGSLNILCTGTMTAQLGGIVGFAGKNSEIKNAVSNAQITYATDIETSSQTNLNVGGIVGNSYGVIDYAESNAKITFNNPTKLVLGGICGRSSGAIFSNIINRSELTVNSCPKLIIAEVSGISSLGYFEKIIDASKIIVHNENIVSDVKAGMLTIFELNDNDEITKDERYTAINSPAFAGVLMTGTVIVNQNGNTAGQGTNLFTYNLGLRNDYVDYVRDESGNYKVIQVPVKDENGDIVRDEETGEIVYENGYETITRIPDKFSKLYALDTYSIKLNNVSDGVETIQTLKITYAKDSSNADLISSYSSSRLLVTFFVRDLGFKYGLNHNEIDLANLDISKMTFTLKSSKWQEKFFEAKSYNGDLTYYDKFIDGACTFDETDEFYSLLSALMWSDTTNLYTPIKVSSRFMLSQMNSISDPETGESTALTNRQLIINFGDNVCRLVSKIVLNSIDAIPDSRKELDAQKQTVSENSVGDVRYEYFSVSDAKYRYEFSLDVSSVVLDQDLQYSFYIIYLQYKKY